jgi:hypothetical protein
MEHNNRDIGKWVRFVVFGYLLVSIGYQLFVNPLGFMASLFSTIMVI